MINSAPKRLTFIDAWQVFISETARGESMSFVYRGRASSAARSVEVARANSTAMISIFLSATLLTIAAPQHSSSVDLSSATANDGRSLTQANNGRDAIPSPACICLSTNKSQWLTVSGVAHLLLYYKLGAADLPSFPSGAEMLKTLTDESCAIKSFGKSPFVITRYGLRYFLSDDPVFHSRVGETHRDQCLATFAELSLPLDTPIHLDSGTFSISSLLNESVAGFNLEEKEPAWTAISYATYLAPSERWTNKFGETTSFSQLAQHLMGADLNSQSCGGTHIFEALIRINRSDKAHPILDKKTRLLVKSYIRNTASDIVKRQHSDGSWDKQWCDGVRPDDGSTGMGSAQLNLLITGHVLQTLCELDPESRPSNEIYLRAAKWLKKELKSTDMHYDVSWLCPFTHAALNSRDVLTGSFER